LTYTTQPDNEYSREIPLRKTQKRQVRTPPNKGFGFFNTGDIEIDFAPEDPEIGNTIYRMPEEAIINNFLLKCSQ
jgi:hypothetical protein